MPLWRSERTICMTRMVGSPSGQQPGRHAAAEKTAAPRQREGSPAGDREAEAGEPFELLRVDRRLDPGQLERLVQAEPEHHLFGRACRGRKLLQLARRPLAAAE